MDAFLRRFPCFLPDQVLIKREDQLKIMLPQRVLLIVAKRRPEKVRSS